MALSDFQRDLCRLLAQSRQEAGLSYIAGGAALNEMMDSPRLSRDVDIFHDTLEALEATWKSDRTQLENAGYQITPIRTLTGFIEAEIARGDDRVLLQWARDSAFRFFPLLPHPDFGLTLHPFDLATNKVLALVGRLETRDWIDALACHENIAPLGLLAWAACGKDEGWNPQLIIEEANRNARLSGEEWQEIEWQGDAPNLVEMKTRWRRAVTQAQEIIVLLPPEEIGHAVLNESNEIFRGDIEALQIALEESQLQFYAGHIGGAWPQIKPIEN
jgi:hypothetical protein